MFSSTTRPPAAAAGLRYAVPAAHRLARRWCWPPAAAAADAGGPRPAPDGQDALDKAERRHHGVVLARHGRQERRGAHQAGRREFNQKNTGKIEVKATYAGKYDDAITKYKAAIQSKSTPDVIQIYDIGTRFMIDAKQTVPMQEFIDRDKLDVSDLQPNIAGYYSVDDKLHSMPFNTSMPVMYYNKTLFKKAGLDPEKPPATLDGDPHRGREAVEEGRRPGRLRLRRGDLRLAARAVHRHQRRGVLRQGQRPRRQGDQGPVRPGRGQLEVVSWWQKMVKDGLAANTGRDTKAAQAAFKSGQVAITLESTGQLGGFSKASKEAGWELGAANYPQGQGRATPARSSAAPRCGSTAWATRTPTRRPPGSS